MNSDGQYTDRAGRVLRVGDFVTSSGEGDYPAGFGRIVSLPPEGNDWNGFPLVQFGDNRKAHVPDSILTKTTNYYVNQLARLNPDAAFYGLRLDDDGAGVTKRMNVTRDQLNRIAAILTERE